MPSVMILGSGAFGRWLGHEGATLMNGIPALIKEIPQPSLALSTMWGHWNMSAVSHLEEGPHQKLAMLAGTVILAFQPPELWETKF